MNAALKSGPTTYIIDASDCLNRAREILDFIVDWHTKDRDQDPGVGWILAEVQTGINDAVALLASAMAASADDQTIARRDAFYAARQGVAE